MIALGVFLIIGFELTASGWLPSYAVVKGAMDKREATICGTLFWLMMTLFRFIVSGSSAKCSLKLRILTSSLLACSLLCLGLHWLGTSYLVTIMGSAVFGATVRLSFRC